MAQLCFPVFLSYTIRLSIKQLTKEAAFLFVVAVKAKDLVDVASRWHDTKYT